MQNLPHITFPLHSITLLAFYLLVISYTVFTIIFYYHWQNYSISKSATVQTYIAYFGISLPLLAIMGLSVLSI